MESSNLDHIRHVRTWEANAKVTVDQHCRHRVLHHLIQRPACVGKRFPIQLLLNGMKVVRQQCLIQNVKHNIAKTLPKVHPIRKAKMNVGYVGQRLGGSHQYVDPIQYSVGGHSDHGTTKVVSDTQQGVIQEDLQD